MLFAPTLLEAITRGIITEACAATTATPLKNYVGLRMEGGAERSWFDAILSPNGPADPLGMGAGLLNALSWSSNPLPGLLYKTTATPVNRKYYLPYLWESLLPFDSGTMPMKSLASNLAIIRGMQTGINFPAHAQNKWQLLSPFPGESILGEIADVDSSTLIPGISTDWSFRSKKGKNSSSIALDSFPGTLFHPLQLKQNGYVPMTNSASARMGLGTVDRVVTSFIQSLTNQMPKRKAPVIQLLMDNRRKAIELMINGFNGLDTDYQTAFDGYFQTIAAVMDPNPSRILVGLDDRPIKGSDPRLRTWHDDKYPWFDGYDFIDGFRTARC